MNTILEARRLNKKVDLSRNNTLHILKDVDFKIEEGEFVSVMGPSGSGKSTLLYNGSGMDRMTSGSVKFKGMEIGKMKEENLAEIRLNSMGFIFQDINLLKNLSLIDNIIFPALAKKNIDKKTAYSKAEELLRMTGIERLANNSITQVSGGQLQRAGICRALINDPDILFGDEPTGALDSKSAAGIMSLLAEINNKGTTIMLVTHDVKVAVKTERVLFMVDGRITAQKKMGKPDSSGESIIERERRLVEWLIENGF